jgi:Aromatic acid exporter family member 1
VTEATEPSQPPWGSRLADWAWPEHPPRWREVPGRLRPTLSNVTRLTTAGVVAYLFTLLTTKGAVDLTGALTALLVVQASAYSTIKMSVVRVGAVLSGVLVATLLSNWIGLTWWSLGAAIASSLLVAKVLRLGDQALETPISAMLILAVTHHDVAAEIRILDTLIGAGVGVALNLLYPPALPTAPAGRALLRVVDAAATPLRLAGEAFAAGPVTRDDVEAWPDRARAANVRVAEATEAIAALKDSRLLNPRALGTANVEPVLTTGLEALEHCLLAIRALFAVVGAEIPGEEDPDDPYGEELRTAFAVVLHDLADCLRAFGGLVVAEAEGREEETEQALAESLEILRETQAILTELIMVVTHDDSSWLLRGSILAAVGQVLSRLDVEDRARIHSRWKEEQRSRPLAQLPLIIQGVLPHPDRPYPRALEGLVWRKPRTDDPGPTGPSLSSEAGSRPPDAP